MSNQDIEQLRTELNQTTCLLIAAESMLGKYAETLRAALDQRDALRTQLDAHKAAISQLTPEQVLRELHALKS